MALVGLVVAAHGLAPPTFAHDSLTAQIAQVTREIAARPGDAALYVRRGELNRAARRWTESLSDLDRAAALDPMLAAVDRVRASVLLALARPADAVAAATRYLATHPGDHDVLTVRARAHVARRRYRDAAADFTAAIAARPLPDLYIERARAERALGRVGIDAARRGLDEGLQRLGSIVTLELEALDLDIEIRSYEAALARLDRLAAATPRRESWLLRRGMVLERAGRRTEALESYRAALAAAMSLPPWTQQTRATRTLITDLHRHLDRLDGTSPAPRAASRIQP
jgi:tetratricopeptide (TPR) repeat protein